MNLYYINKHLITPDQKRVGIKEMEKIAPEDTEFNCISFGAINPKKAMDKDTVFQRLLSIYLKDSEALVVSDHPLIFHEAVEMFGRAAMFNSVKHTTKWGEVYKPTRLEVRYWNN